MFKSIWIATAVLGLASIGACSPDSSAEKTGENMDSAIENATQGEKNLSDGPLENAGESIDRATGAKNNDPADAAADAVDGDTKTNP